MHYVRVRSPEVTHILIAIISQFIEVVDSAKLNFSPLKRHSLETKD